MAYRFDKQQQLAKDDVSGATVRGVYRFDDISDLTFAYECGDIHFEFHAHSVKEIRRYMSLGQPHEGPVTIEEQIVESDLRTAYGRRSATMYARFPTYEDLRNEVSRGLFVLCSNGGEYLNYSPEFKIGFVDRQVR